MKTSKMIVEGRFMVIQPLLAEHIGFNEALFLQQLHYLSNCQHEAQRNDGWVTKTLAEWTDFYTFWSIGTVRRTITSLEKQQLILTETLRLKDKIGNTKSYRVNYEHPILKKLRKQPENHEQHTVPRSKADARDEAELLEQLAHDSDTNCSPAAVQNVSQTLQKTNGQERKVLKRKE